MAGGSEPPITEWKSKSHKAHRRKVFALAWNSEGKRLASGSADQTVRVHRVDDHCGIKSEGELRGHTDSVTYLRWHPSHPDKLASIAGGEKTVRFWDTRASRNTATVSTPGANLYFAWTPDGHHLAVANRDDVVAIVDTRKMKVAHKYPHKYQINEVAFSGDGQQLLLCTGQGEVEIHSFPDMRKVRTLRGHTASVFALAFDRRYRWLATGGTDAVVCLWDTKDYICQRTYIAMDYPMRTLAFSHDSRYLSMLAEQPLLDVENVETGQSMGRLQLRNIPEDMAWNPKHCMLAHAGEYGRDSQGMEYGNIDFRWKSG